MEWISVKDQKPAVYDHGCCNYEILLFVNGFGKTSIGYCFDDDWADRDKTAVYFNDLVENAWAVGTHWMPLPKPPKE